MILSIASGKGGTGKTTVAAGLVLVAAETTDVRFIDADVEEPNAHILLKPDLTGSNAVTVPVPEIDQARCTMCGHCERVCAFGAIAVGQQEVVLLPALCHGCGGCSLLCPEQAIREVPRVIGEVERGHVGRIVFAHGRLNTGEAQATPVITAVKREISGTMPTIIDSPPGTSCAMVESIRGSDMCLLVTEPTPLGVSDLALALDVTEKLRIPVAVVINRCDIGDQAELYCRSRQVPVALKLPYDQSLAEAYARGDSPLINQFWRRKFESLVGAVNLTDRGDLR